MPERALSPVQQLANILLGILMVLGLFKPSVIPQNLYTIVIGFCLFVGSVAAIFSFVRSNQKGKDWAIPFVFVALDIYAATPFLVRYFSMT